VKRTVDRTMKGGAMEEREPEVTEETESSDVEGHRYTTPKPPRLDTHQDEQTEEDEDVELHVYTTPKPPRLDI
jgi:hypothetical protein